MFKIFTKDKVGGTKPIYVHIYFLIFFVLNLLESQSDIRNTSNFHFKMHRKMETCNFLSYKLKH